MPSDNIACGGTVIKYKDLKKICPKETKKLEHFMEKNKDLVVWNDIGTCGNDESFDFEGSHDLVKILKDLKETFEANTRVDDSYLELSFTYYNADDGSRYDDLTDFHKQGCIFLVDGHTQPTPAGKEFKNILHNASWSQWG